MNDYVREFDIANGRLPAGGQRKSRNIVEFFNHQFRDEDASEKAGRPIYREVTMVRIAMPGDKNSVVERKVRPADKVEYAPQWAAFERAEKLAEDGTPLEHWALLDRTTSRELKYFNVATVEQLAGLTDGEMQQIGMLGLRTLVKQAKAFLEHAKTGQLPAAIVAENDKLKSEIDGLKKALADANLRFETELRALGGNAATVAGAQPIAEAKAMEPVSVAVSIPDDFTKMSNKEVAEMARKITGFSFKTRAEAEEALRDAKGQ